MIGGIYSESDIWPGILPVLESTLLESVASAEPVATVHSEGRISFLRAELQYGSYAAGTVAIPRTPTEDSSLILDHIFAGDVRLIGSGVGARLVRAITDLAVNVSPTCNLMRTGWVRLGAINAIEKVFPGQMRVELGKDAALHYGFDTGRSLEQMLVDHPPSEGKAFMAQSTTTKIR